ncbi:carbohydrate ABC transporter permease [Allofournierella sp.]|uniref:carbohydrate ABC transporter permease n=1 Tax=Allofournierella sp. TaxID=1940256 RepID=UPI003AB63A20
MKRRQTPFFFFLVFLGLSFIVLAPALYLLAHTFFNNSGQFTLVGYYEMFLHSPRYLARFWRSLAICFGITAGNLVISTMAGYALAFYTFRGRTLVLFLLAILMLLPVQTTLTPTYMVLKQLHLLDTQLALILPALFWPFGTLLEMQVMRALPKELFEAAELDGANLFHLISYIALPSAKGGVISVAILTFIEAWNMLEQPAAYLTDSANYPLAAFLAYGAASEQTVIFISSILAILPVLLVFAYFNEELTAGIEFTGIK